MLVHASVGNQLALIHWTNDNICTLNAKENQFDPWTRIPS
jgi:hypothetical protein